LRVRLGLAEREERLEPGACAWEITDVRVDEPAVTARFRHAAGVSALGRRALGVVERVDCLGESSLVVGQQTERVVGLRQFAGETGRELECEGTLSKPAALDVVAAMPSGEARLRKGPGPRERVTLCSGRVDHLQIVHPRAVVFTARVLAVCRGQHVARARCGGRALLGRRLATGDEYDRERGDRDAPRHRERIEKPI
jgi:hypothetical protein